MSATSPVPIQTRTQVSLSAFRPSRSPPSPAPAGEGWGEGIQFRLANLHGVETWTLKQAVRRNVDRFPDDFMVELTDDEIVALVSQTVIPGLGKHRAIGYHVREQTAPYRLKPPSARKTPNAHHVPVAATVPVAGIPIIQP